MIVDPGHDFHKNTFHSLELARRLGELADLGHPLLVGLSNKDFVGESLDVPLDQRLEGSLAAAAFCVSAGASIVRVHEVEPTVRVVRMTEAILGRRPRRPPAAASPRTRPGGPWRTGSPSPGRPAASPTASSAIVPAPVNGSSPPAGPLEADEDEPSTSDVVLVASTLLELAPEVVVAPEVLVAPEVEVPPLVVVVVPPVVVVVVVGLGAQPVTQKTLCLTSAPWSPRRGSSASRGSPARVGLDAGEVQGVGLAGVEPGLAATAAVVVLADEHGVAEQDLSSPSRWVGGCASKMTSASVSPSS